MRHKEKILTSMNYDEMINHLMVFCYNRLYFSSIDEFGQFRYQYNDLLKDMQILFKGLMIKNNMLTAWKLAHKRLDKNHPTHVLSNKIVKRKGYKIK